MQPLGASLSIGGNNHKPLCPGTFDGSGCGPVAAYTQSELKAMVGNKRLPCILYHYILEWIDKKYIACVCVFYKSYAIPVYTHGYQDILAGLIREQVL